MASVTEADVNLINDIKAQTFEVMLTANDLTALMDKVARRIDPNEMTNDGTDFAVIVTKYTPEWDIKLAAFKVLVESLPRWDQV